MASILDTLRIVFGAEWSGGGAVNRMAQDLQRAERNAANIGKAFADMSSYAVVGINSISPVGAKAAVQLQALHAHANELRTSMASLGQGVVRGNLVPPPHVGI